jgi:hypothetical protein
MKIVVFDLDETLGYFTEFGIFWDSLTLYLKKSNNLNLTQNNFNDILDLFPEFLRPNIINILTYLKDKKKSNRCHKMMIYTNNNGPKEWSNHIIQYFEKKIDFKLIDQLISAFKINGKNVEICRTTHNKTHQDFIRCTKIRASDEICFLDDTFYPEMANDNIYYINIKPYYYDLQFDYMITKFQESAVGKMLINNDDSFKLKLMEYIKRYEYESIQKNPMEYNVDKILGKHIITHLEEFFNKHKQNKTYKRTKTRTYRNLKHNKTKKC